MHTYERECSALGKTYGVFDLGKYAGVGASLAVSLVAPFFAVVKFSAVKDFNFYLSILVWILGVSFVYSLCLVFKRKDHLADSGKIPDTAKATHA